MRKNNNILLLLTILLFSFWLRIQNFLSETFAFTYDVGRDLLAVDQIVVAHKLTLIGATTGLPGVFYGPTWYYALVPSFVLSGGDPKGVLLFMILLGVLSVFLGYLLGRRLGGNFLGIMLALFIGMSATLVGLSGQIWNPNPIPVVVVAFLYAITFLNEKKVRTQKISALAAGLLIGIIIDLELVFGLLFLLSTLIYLFLFAKLPRKLIQSAFAFAGIFLVILPRIVFELRHDFLMSRTLFSSVLSGSQESLFTLQPRFGKIFELLTFIFTDTIGWKISILSVLIFSFMVFVFTKSFKKMSDSEKKLLLFCTLVIACFFVGLSFFNHEMESHYYVGLPMIFVILPALAIYVAKKYLALSPFLSAGIIVLLAMSISQLSLFQTFTKNNWEGDASVYRNQKAVIDLIYTDAKGKLFNTTTYTPPIHDYPYQYLFKWYGQDKYGYVPDNNKQELFYLIIERDPQFPVRQEAWLEARKTDGKIIFEKRLTGDITVQKRIH